MHLGEETSHPIAHLDLGGRMVGAWMFSARNGNEPQRLIRSLLLVPDLEAEERQSYGRRGDSSESIHDKN